MNTPNAIAFQLRVEAGDLVFAQDLPRDQARGEPAEEQIKAEVGGEQR
jgi:hypothetical protein